MNRASLLRVVILLATGLVAWLVWSAFREQPEDQSISVLSGLSNETSPLFSRADGPRSFVFPRDHGAHEEFQTEWWYYTGNLVGTDGRRFGYQLTFFRRAILPPVERVERESNWASEQIYLAHFAISDVQSNRFHFDEKVSRGAVGLAGAQGEPLFQVWLEDWRVEQLDAERYRMTARATNFALSLELIDRKGVILQGQDGYSRKGEQPGNASYYISLTRLESWGQIELDGETFSVTGWSWMDHEFSTSALGENQVGWDWFSLQLDNETEIMLFTLRNEDGGIDSFSSATVIDPRGKLETFAQNEFSVQVLERWRSPHNQADYPARWKIEIPSRQIELQVQPLMADQELRVSFIYWEGAVKANGMFGAILVEGYGYIELTGYAQSMRGRF